MSLGDFIHPFTSAPGPRLSETICALTSSGQCRCTSRPEFLVVRTSNVLSIDNLSLFVQRKEITDQGSLDDVRVEQWLGKISYLP